MKKIMAVLSDESYEILKRYQKEGGIANLDTTLDNLIRETKDLDPSVNDLIKEKKKDERE
jgi:hypothetical protein